MNKHNLDNIHKSLIDFFSQNREEEGLTLREIASQLGIKHPQTVLNKLNQLVAKGYFIKDNKGFRIIKTSNLSLDSDVFYLPVYGFAQCGNNGKSIVNEHSQEKMPVTMAFLGVKSLDKCFFVRAKGNSMEPKIQDNDLVLIKQQDSYNIEDYVFVVHNNQPKLKKIFQQNDKFYLESINRFFVKKEIKPYDENKIIGIVKKIIKTM